MNKNDIMKIALVGGILGLLLTCNLIFYPCCIITACLPGLIIIHWIYVKNPDIDYKESIKYTLPTGALAGFISTILISVLAVGFGLVSDPSSPFNSGNTKELIGTGIGIALAPCICSLPGLLYGGIASSLSGITYLFVRNKLK